MTLLTLVQDAAAEIGIRRPSAVVGSSDVEVIKLLRYAKKEGKELPIRGEWQQLRTQSTFTSLATETQTGMVPSDLARFVNETFWNRSARRRFYGPLNSQDWQTLKAMSSSPIVDTFTYYGSDILIQPVPTAGETYAFEYISTKYCASSGGTAQTVWTADTDTGRIPEELFTLGIIWRFKQGEGVPYQVDQANYEAQVRQYLTGNKPKRTVDMSGGNDWGRVPGIYVPEGSWNIT